MFKNTLIIGSGTMGTSIAAFFAVHAHQSTVIVHQETHLEQARLTLETQLAKYHKKTPGLLPVSDLLSRIQIAHSAPSNQTFDMIFEAIPEDLQLKKVIIGQYQNCANPETVWASSTSSLSITEMSSVYPYPANFIGLHFFNPVMYMELVEIIPSMLTALEVFDKCYQFCESLGKKPVRVDDSPGFIVNRLLIPLINEAAILLENGVATAAEIDSAMRNGAHHPLGPLALADLIGNDICLSIMESLYSNTCDSKYRPSYLLRKMVSAKKLGRKTGQGFYQYDSKGNLVNS